jgi:glyoxylase-like metal-dependent hydrolase (beta-lactamase superfamily II)
MAAEPELPVADRWFEFRRIDDDITLIWEPHTAPLVRCNMWHVRGRDRDLMVDTGMGIASLRAAARHLFDKTVTAVATHTHLDHAGSLHEFEERLVHRAEADFMASPDGILGLRGAYYEPWLAPLRDVGYAIPALFVTARPDANYDIDAYRLIGTKATRIVEDGDVVDIGGRRFEVLHLPGHSPGSIGLWEAETGTLFSGDALYDSTLFDTLAGCDIPAYIRTMERLRELPVTVVHAGHLPSFGRERHLELIDAYLDWRRPRAGRSGG